MRLRSSKFVVLLLLACCVQFGEDAALRLCAAPSLRSAVRGDVCAAPVQAGRNLLESQLRPVIVALPATARAFAQIAWTMRHPAADSTALMHHTGLLRA